MKRRIFLDGLLVAAAVLVLLDHVSNQRATAYLVSGFAVAGMVTLLRKDQWKNNYKASV